MPIVVGYVDTPEGNAALEASVAQAERLDTRLVVILSDKSSGQLSPADEAAAERIRADLDARGVAHDVRHLSRGKDAAEDIVTAAVLLDAELIVIGLRRRSPVGKLFLGSNAQRILLDAPCPVLAVKSAPA